MNGKLGHVLLCEQVRDSLKKERERDVFIEVVDFMAFSGQQRDLVLLHWLTSRIT